MAPGSQHARSSLRAAARRRQVIEYHGSRCHACGSGERLCIVGGPPNGNLVKLAQAKFDALLPKVSIECRPCIDKRLTTARGTHGTVSSYRYCKCDECRAAKAARNSKRVFEPRQEQRLRIALSQPKYRL